MSNDGSIKVRILTGLLTVVYVFLLSSCNITGNPGGFTLETFVLPEDGGTVVSTGGELSAGSSIELRAEPTEGYKFVRWEGDLTGTNNPDSLIFDSDKGITAIFELLVMDNDDVEDGDNGNDDVEDGDNGNDDAEDGDNGNDDAEDGDNGLLDDILNISITDISGPTAVVQGESITIYVTVENLGTLNVRDDIDVELIDLTDDKDIDEQEIKYGLNTGITATLTFIWKTDKARVGVHTLVARHDFDDDENKGNLWLSTTIEVTEKGKKGK
jgi:hypothetical protein